MNYVVLARKYRPQTFEELLGQDSVRHTLQNALKGGRLAHAYLFCGPRGTGKTSAARILAKAVNCLQSPGPEPCLKCEACAAIATGSDVDVLELDAASRRKVDEIQPLIESARYLPQRSERKVFIIDEAHMLSAHAFNALLKTFEEPPPHVLFILATTAPQKIPETVRSRCHRFDFRRFTEADIVAKLGRIAQNEKWEIAPGVLEEIAGRAQGGMRDAESLLDQVIAAASGERPSVSLEDLARVLGGVPTQFRRRILECAREGDMPGVLEAAEKAVQEGGDALELLHALRGDLRDDAVAAARAGEQGAAALDWSLAAAELLGRHVHLAAASRASRASLDLALLALARLGDVADLEELVQRLERMGDAGPAGAAPVRSARPAARAAGSAAQSGADEEASPIPRAPPPPRAQKAPADVEVPRVPAQNDDGAAGAQGSPAEADPPRAGPELTPEELRKVRSHPAVRAVMTEFRGRLEQVRREDDG